MNTRIESLARLSKGERRVRKWWLLVSCFKAIIGPAILILFTVYSHHRWTGKDIRYISEWLVLGGIGFLVVYLCAYRRPGTALLLWPLVWLPVKVIYDLLKIRFNAQWFICFLLWTSLSVLLWVLTFKLRKSNLKIRYHEFVDQDKR